MLSYWMHSFYQVNEAKELTYLKKWTWSLKEEQHENITSKICMTFHLLGQKRGEDRQNQNIILVY